MFVHISSSFSISYKLQQTIRIAKMFFTRFIIAALTVTTALSLHDFHALNPHVFGKRQEYQPSTYTCGAGATCEIACGAGSVECGDALCINPDLGHVCCEPGSADPCKCSSPTLHLLRFSPLTHSLRGLPG
jgi:hypothetical protein